MQLKTVVLVFAVCIGWCIFPCVDAQQCTSMADKPHFAPCTVAGYNTTYPPPSYVSSRTLSFVGRYHNYFIRQAQNCSVVQIAESIICAVYAPYCREGAKNALLPCRRVCVEFLRRCEGTVSEYMIDEYMALCTLLPNETAASGNCYEPPEFTDLHVNTTDQGPYDRPCEKLVNFPICNGLGYEYTIPSAENQARAYRFFYRKNITDPDNETPAPGSIMERIMWTMGNYSKCALNIKKLFCASIIEPCWPEEGKAYYTVCNNVCKSIGEQCPDILTGRGARYYANCERFPDDTTSHGFCKHTKWPPPRYWREFMPVQPTSKPKTNTTAILIGVLVPVVFILIVLTAVIAVLWKQNKLTSMFSYKRYEDEATPNRSVPPPNTTNARKSPTLN